MTNAASKSPGAERVISGVSRPDDENLDLSLRPRQLAEFVGQAQVKDNLTIGIKAAQLRGGAAGSYHPLWAAGLGQNYPGPHHCPGNGGEHQGYFRPGH